uniref:Uncharacterized protein n=1 Tax=Rhizophora mucronata TaxID=61149 RepID=A0A2P2QZ25_RHIMU
MHMVERIQQRYKLKKKEISEYYTQGKMLLLGLDLLRQ